MKKFLAVFISFHLIVAPVLAAPASNNVEESNDAYLNGDNGLGIGGSGSRGGLDFYTNQVLIIGTSAIGANIVTQCIKGLMLPSIATYMAGSTVHIMSEILGAKAKNERHKTKMRDLKLKEEQLKKIGDVSQKEIMIHQISEEKDTLEFIKNRRKWMTAVTVIYTAAMGLAIAEQINAVSAATAAAAAAVAAGPVASAVAYRTTYMLAADAGCIPPTGATLLAAKGLGLLVASGYGFVGSSGGTISNYGTKLVGTLSMLIPSLSNAVKPAYGLPIPRAITFGSSAVLSGAVTAGFMVREKLAEKNISKLNSALAKFTAETETPDTGIVEGDKNHVENGSETEKLNYDLKNLVVNKKKECFSNQDNKWEHSAASCIRPLKLGKANLANIKLPTINNVSKLATDLSHALAEGDEAKAGNIAGEIGNFAARVKKENDSLKAEFNKLQKKNIKDPTDFDKSIQTQVASLNKELNNAATAGKVDLASLGGSDKTVDEPVKDAALPVVTTSNAPVATMPEADPLAGMGSSEEMPMDEAVLPKSASQSLNDFESSAQDISKEPEVSLFKQVSNRYILNYEKMFNRKKAPEATTESLK